MKRAAIQAALFYILDHEYIEMKTKIRDNIGWKGSDVYCLNKNQSNGLRKSVSSWQPPARPSAWARFGSSLM